MLLFASLAFVFSICQAVLASSRTSAPPGAIVVRAGTNTAGEFATVSAAINSLPNDSSSRSIFIYPGTYNEQVYITRTGPLTIYGYTASTSTYTENQVTIQAGVGASTTISDDASGTLRVHKNDFKMYNVNVKNTFGVGTQAIAISQYGSRVGLYACGFYGYQDTLYANQGTQVYLKGYIQGATDFIFGRLGLHISEATPSPCLRPDVFNQNTIVLAPGAAASTTRGYYLGRPWADFAKVIFKNTVITAPINPAVWSPWSAATPNTDNILFAEYNTTGSGVSGVSRASFSTVLSASQAAAYSISSAVGSDYASWVDAAYIV
ncbi:pectinesterase [Infundibulicybe gibba]|nr:pectinesterase [Infundibulicybe gibba]